MLRERRCAPGAGRLFRDRGHGAASCTGSHLGQTIHPFHFKTPARFGLDEYDLADQGLISHHYADRDGTFGPQSIPFRYVWPSELDLMARLADMRRRERWSGWRREPFTSESDKLVGVWEKLG